MLKRLLAVALAAMALPLPALAGPSTDVVRRALYDGTIDAGLVEIRPLAFKGDPESRFGLGFLAFVGALEDLAQALYRHGLAAPDSGPLGPVLSVPIPPNPAPEPLDYETFRTVLLDFVDTLDAAASILEEAGRSGDYVVKLDLLKVRIDINADGQATEVETVGNVIASAFGINPAELSAPPPPSGARNQTGASPATPEAGSTEVGFDRADAIWLAGYSNVLAGYADFLLAHDFSDMFNATFHRVFPKAGLPMQEFSRGGMLMLDPDSDNAIADFVALIHTINWPVVEQERMLRVLERARKITALSRKNWEAILAETDDDHELVPNPRQTPPLPEGKVTEEIVAAWHATLDTADQIIEGQLLIPHWRFKQGFDLKAYFETATRTDFVMILTGFGALPFLKDGPIATAESFAEANRVFGDNLLGYAFWFN